MRVDLQPAYVLHNRPYRDSSVMAEVFTPEYGRISIVARGARRQSRRGSGAGLLQPFVPLLVSFSGRSELKTLVAMEASGPMTQFTGTRLYSALYTNELLMRLLHRHDAHPGLFAAYTEVLTQLAGSENVEDTLRQFEFSLLEELGYSFDPGIDALSGEEVRSSAWYRFEPGRGLVACSETTAGAGARYRGSQLLAMRAGMIDDAVRRARKSLLREALAVHLGSAPLRSRELFRAAQRKPLFAKSPFSGAE